MTRLLLPILVWCVGLAAAAQAPVGTVPARGTEAAPRTEGRVEALARDADEYARQYDLPFEDALRRLEWQSASIAATDALAQEFAPRLAGIAVEHRPAFRIVVLLAGDAPVADRTIAAGGLEVPVTFRTGAAATRVQLLAAITAHQADIRASLVAAPGLGVDARTGALALMVGRPDLEREGRDALAARLSALAGVPVELRAWDRAEVELAQAEPGGAEPPPADAPAVAADPVPVDPGVVGGGRVTGIDPADGRRYACTSGFVVTDGVRTGIATAAHCPDALEYRAPDGAATPLTLVGAWGALYQDVQIHVADRALDPSFYADTARTLLRTLTGWRNRASLRAGDFVCHRGERTGYSCAEVAFADYAPPGDLCAGPCPPTWVAVKGPHCKGGDSGGPVFDGTLALGLVKGGSYAPDGTCRLYYFMSTDYLPPGWLLLHG